MRLIEIQEDLSFQTKLYNNEEILMINKIYLKIQSLKENSSQILSINDIKIYKNKISLYNESDMNKIKKSQEVRQSLENYSSDDIINFDFVDDIYSN